MMKSKAKFACVTAALLMSSSLAASAALLDFTDEGAYDVRNSSEAKGTVGGVEWTVRGNPADSLTYTPFDGNASDLGPLKGDFDGIGVVDDEISSADGIEESVTVSFNRSVSVNGVYFLDLFTSKDGESNEIAKVFLGGDTGGMLLASFDANDAAIVGNDSGFRFGGLDGAVTADALTFAAFLDNDKVGLADFALAGIDLDELDQIAPIPLPAGVVLLGSGLLAFGATKRRRKA